MKSIDTNISVKLSKMSLLCAVMVVGLHIGRATGIAGEVISNVLIREVFTIAVPFFFLASGYLLAKNIDDVEWYKVALTKRMKTVLIPMLSVGVIFALFEICLTVIANLIVGRALSDNFYRGWEWLRVIGMYPFDFPGMRTLWYLRSLLICVLISPIIAWALKIRELVLYLVVVFIASAYVETMLVNYSPIWHLFCTIFSLRGIFWFSIGMYLMIKPVQMRFPVWFCSVLGLMGLIVPIVICNIFDMGEGKIVRYCAVPFIMIGVWSILSNTKWDVRITSLSFPIYLIHMFFVDATNCVGLNGDNLSILLWILKYSVAVFGSIAVALFCVDFYQVLLKYYLVADEEATRYSY